MQTLHERSPEVTLKSLYDMIKSQNVSFNGVGVWNPAVVKALPNKHVEHWLNGKKVLEYDRGSQVAKIGQTQQNMLLPILTEKLLAKLLKVISYCKITGNSVLHSKT